MEAPPSASFKIPEPDLLLKFLIIALDAPAQFGSIDPVPGCDVFRKSGEPVFGWLVFTLGPLNQQPLFRWPLGPFMP